MWGLIISAAASVIGGMQSSAAAKAEAKRAQQYAAYNSAAAQNWGNTQSRLTMMSAIYNANNMKKQAAFNAQQNTAWINYNANVSREVQAYNDLLYSDQIDQIFEQADLSSEQLHVDYVKAQGTTVAQQAASGTTIGFGSNKDVEVDMTAEEAIFQLIIANNADKQASSILNAQKQGKWQMDMSIQKMRYEGQLQNASTMYNVNADASAALYGGAMNAFAQREQGRNQSLSTWYSGAQTADNQNAQASMYMTQGFMNGASSAASAYGQYRMSNVGSNNSTTTSLLASESNPYSAGASKGNISGW